MRQAVKERFEQKFERITESGCWIWLASIRYLPAKLGKLSYGRFGYKGRAASAHRVSWELYRGEIPHGLSVLHRCDIPLCVNPSHLFLGTQRENMRDAVRKGKPMAAKLRHFQVTEIRNSEICNSDLAAFYGVEVSAIQRIKRGASWRVD